MSWGDDGGPRISLGINASSENVGFVGDVFLFGANSYAKIGDNAYVWVKPIDMVKLTLGKNDSSWGTSLGFGLYDWYRFGAIDKEDEEIFSKHINKNQSVIVTPIEGLSIGMGMNAPIDGKFQEATLNDVVGRTGAVAIKYDVAGVGTVKLGVMGDNVSNDKTLDSVDTLDSYGADAENGGLTRTSGTTRFYEDDDGEDYKDFAIFNAAFELTAVENLWAAIGVKYGTEAYKNVGTDEAPVYVKAYTPQIAAKVRYNADPVTINAIAHVMLDTYDTEEKEKDGQVGFKVGAGVEYSLGDGLAILADVRYANGIWMKNSSADHMDALTFGAAIRKDYTNGSFGVGFEGTTNDPSTKDGEGFRWAIPVLFKASF